jgi:hypothetical protein
LCRVQEILVGFEHPYARNHDVTLRGENGRAIVHWDAQCDAIQLPSPMASPPPKSRLFVPTTVVALAVMVNEVLKVEILPSASNVTVPLSVKAPEIGPLATPEAVKVNVEAPPGLQTPSKWNRLPLSCSPVNGDDGVGVLVGVAVSIGVGVSVGVLVAVLVGVFVVVSVGVFVAVFVGVLVGVLVGALQ